MKKHTILKKLSNFSKIKSYAVIIGCVAFFCCKLSFAAENFLQQYSTELNEIETYLNNIKNLSANFTQRSDNGALVKGKFYLSRPGKMRVEYNAEPKVLIVVNDSVLSYHDIELDEISHLRTNTTPASFLTRPNISFSAKDVEITNVAKSSNQIAVSVMKKNRKDAGEFTLAFSTNPLEFKRMEVKNDLNQVVIVSLNDIDFISEIPNKKFVIESKIIAP